MKFKPSKDVIRKSVQEELKYVPKRLLEVAETHNWEVQSVSTMWTRFKKDGVSIEVKYNRERRETRGRAYVRDVVFTAVFHSQREIIEYMAKP